MARQTLSPQSLAHGLAPTYSAVLGADDAQFLYDPDAFLHIQNTTGSGIVLTIPTNGQVIDGDLTVPNRTITIPANGYKFTNVFAKDTYKQTDGYVYLNAPSDGLSIAVLKK